MNLLIERIAKPDHVYLVIVSQSGIYNYFKNNLHDNALYKFSNFNFNHQVKFPSKSVFELFLNSTPTPSFSMSSKMHSFWIHLRFDCDFLLKSIYQCRIFFKTDLNSIVLPETVWTDSTNYSNFQPFCNWALLWIDYYGSCMKIIR